MVERNVLTSPRQGNLTENPVGVPLLLPRMPKERGQHPGGPLRPRATGQPSGMSETVPLAHPISILEEALGTQLH